MSLLVNNYGSEILKLNPDFWFSADYINGFSSPNPPLLSEIYEWKDLSGNNRHAVSENFGVLHNNGTRNSNNAIQTANTTTILEDYKGAEFIVPDFTKTSNDFTMLIVKDVGERFNSFGFVNQFGSASTLGGFYNITARLGKNNNQSAIIFSNVNGVTYLPLDINGKISGDRNVDRNLLNEVMTFTPFIWRYKHSTGVHTISSFSVTNYNTFTKLATSGHISNPNYVISVGQDYIEPVAGGQFWRVTENSYEYAFFQKHLSDEDIKSLQSYITLKYKI